MAKVGQVSRLRAAGCDCRRPLVRKAGPWVVCGGCESRYPEDGLTKAARHGVAGSSACHYCGARDRELTRDHIVPRSVVPGRRGEGVRNIVLACRPCNAGKAALRSGCGCAKCRWAWNKWGPEGWEEWDTWAPQSMYKASGM